MNNKNFLFALIATPVFFISMAKAAMPTDEAILIENDKAMQRTLVDHNPEAHGKWLTDNYTLVTSKGKIITKQEFLRDLTRPDAQFEINESSDWSVRVFKDTAIVIAVLHQKGKDGERQFDHRVRYTDTWIRNGNKWLVMAAHASKLPD